VNSQIIIKDCLVSYSSQGQEKADYCLLFLHGWRSAKEIWQPVMSKLSIVNCQLLALDLPGFGSSPAPKQPWTVGDYAEVVKGFIEKLELKNVILVGHSFGGRVGIKLAAKYPDLINKLVLVDSAGFAMPSPRKSVLATAAKIAKPFFKPKFMQGLRKKIYKTMGAEDYVATPELQKTFINIVSEDLTEDIKRIKTPTLIIWGADDEETPVEFGKKMNSLILNSKFLLLPKAGHFSFLDQTEGFVKSITEFVN